MKRPKSLKAGPYDYTIEWADEPEWAASPGKEAWAGVSTHSTHRIVVRLNNPDEGGRVTEAALQETLLHEIGHVAFHVSGLDQYLPDNEEQIVHLMSTPLLSILRDNPRVIAYLTST